jgi:geranylgeranyl diphosphate synthase type I
MFRGLIAEDTLSGERALAEPALDAVLGGGRHVRAALPGAAAAALAPGRANERAMAWVGLALEVIHAATLCHDDILDEDEERRGLPSVWKRWGVPQALTLGDYLFYVADEAVHRAGLSDGETLAALRVVACELRSVARGQAEENRLRAARELPTEPQWAWIAARKTGGLFGLGMQLGALHVAPERADAVRAAGHRLGELYQLCDDLLDIVGDKGRPRASDLREGKPSWLVAHAASSIRPGEAERFAELLYAPRAQKTERDVVALLAILEATGAIDAAYAAIDRAARAVVDAIAGLPPTFVTAMDGWVSLAMAPISHARAKLGHEQAAV